MSDEALDFSFLSCYTLYSLIPDAFYLFSYCCIYDKGCVMQDAAESWRPAVLGPEVGTSAFYRINDIRRQRSVRQGMENNDE
ncbi:unnamed protein product [Gongylonema pulchrum]|uniref:Uncharacterized protein n=1 Tax=Gongylonema pulchrum TaxID=637853 RepID=A0A183ELA9_9BILA|nr:unnamed protein product [Gongylonema pulchrum]